MVCILPTSDVAISTYARQQVLEQGGDRRGAISAYELASRLATFDTDPLVNLGGVLLAEQKFDLAVSSFV